MREIKLTDITREELWAKQRLSFTDIDYAVWERNKSMLHQFSKMNRNCTFLIFTVFVFSMRGNNTCVLSAGIRFWSRPSMEKHGW